jgi:CO/xanthine dehydrogenase FAD-binding subunit
VDIAISAGPLGPVPARLRRTEEFLRGKTWSVELIRQATAVLLDEAALRTSPHRATREYRQELLPTLLARTLTAAVERASEA